MPAAEKTSNCSEYRRHALPIKALLKQLINIQKNFVEIAGMSVEEKFVTKLNTVTWTVLLDDNFIIWS